MRSRRCWFGRPVREEQQLKKHQDHSIQSQRLLLLESFVDYVDKPCVCVNLVGPQVSLPTGAPQMLVEGIIFSCNKEAVDCVRPGQRRE